MGLRLPALKDIDSAGVERIGGLHEVEAPRRLTGLVDDVRVRGKKGRSICGIEDQAASDDQHEPTLGTRGVQAGGRTSEDQRSWSRNRGTIPGMDEPEDLQYNGCWRTAVWALRVGFVGLAVAIAGLIAMSLGSTPWALAVGVIIWLASAAVTLTGFLWSRHELPVPRPRYWSMRFMLIRDTVHARSSAQRS